MVSSDITRRAMSRYSRIELIQAFLVAKNRMGSHSKRFMAGWNKMYFCLALLNDFSV